MCIICERELWGEHRALEREFLSPAAERTKVCPGASSEKGLLSLFCRRRHDR